jgi:hypothetical protein
LATYEKRLKIPHSKRNDSLTLKTENGLILATGYNRIVIGSRGPYVEFHPEHIVCANIVVPTNQSWRLKHDNVYYNEYRSRDYCNVKLYEQRRVVDYADYIVGMWYISPFALWSEEGVLIESLRKSKK